MCVFAVQILMETKNFECYKEKEIDVKTKNFMKMQMK